MTDREGNMLEQHRPEPHEAIRADTAYIITNLLHGVVQHGTARSAARARLAAGRQDRHDRRLHRRVVRRLRSGHHDRRLDRLRSEDARSAPDRRGTSAALPIWIDIMKTWVDPPARGAARAAGVRAPRQHRRHRRRPPGRRPSSPAPSRGAAGIAGIATSADYARLQISSSSTDAAAPSFPSASASDTP